MHKKIIATFLMISILSGCEDFVTVELPDSLIGSKEVFENEQTAQAASVSMYRSLLGGYGLLGGTIANVTYMTGMSSDEIVSYSTSDAVREFYVNAININNTNILRLWTSAYNTLYEANGVIEGVTRSQTIPSAVKNQLIGEARFVRALCHFFLTNMFGDIPLATTTDYRINASRPRTSVENVYAHMLEDVHAAQMLLSEATKIRPGKSAATALLARIYLYLKKYSEAETEATTIINNPAFSLQPLNNVFLTGSAEAIWQLSQVAPASLATGDGAVFIIYNNFFQNALSPEIVTAFEPSDQRWNAWVRSWTLGADTYYYVAKYKIRNSPSTTVFTEQLVVFRLAEQYLIRAEARAHQDNLQGAIADLDVIRLRAGLPLLAEVSPEITKEELLNRIFQERRVELFCETAHRWFDLKRTTKVDAVLGAVKPGWSTEDALYPIPETELLANPALEPQNPGY